MSARQEKFASLLAQRSPKLQEAIAFCVMVTLQMCFPQNYLDLNSTAGKEWFTAYVMQFTLLYAAVVAIVVRLNSTWSDRSAPVIIHRVITGSFLAMVIFIDIASRTHSSLSAFAPVSTSIANAIYYCLPVIVILSFAELFLLALSQKVTPLIQTNDCYLLIAFPIAIHLNWACYPL